MWDILYVYIFISNVMQYRPRLSSFVSRSLFHIHIIATTPKTEWPLSHSSHVNVGWSSGWVWSDQCCAREISQSCKSGLSSRPGQDIWERHTANAHRLSHVTYCQPRELFTNTNTNFYRVTHTHTGTVCRKYLITTLFLFPRAAAKSWNGHVFPPEWTHSWYPSLSVCRCLS